MPRFLHELLASRAVARQGWAVLPPFHALVATLPHFPGRNYTPAATNDRE